MKFKAPEQDNLLLIVFATISLIVIVWCGIGEAKAKDVLITPCETVFDPVDPLPELTKL